MQRRTRPLIALFGSAVLASSMATSPLLAQEDGSEKPLSAIDWLSQSVVTNAGSGAILIVPDEPPIADNAATPDITVTPLDRPSPDVIGLLGSAVTGLPPNLWSGSDGAMLTTLIQAERVETLPAVQDLIVESNDPNGPHGAKEAGEGPLHPAIPAIANAIYDAVGVRLTELPFHPAVLLRALKGKTC